MFSLSIKPAAVTNYFLLNQSIKIFTNEIILHAQIQEIKRVLNREVIFDIVLNKRDERSCIQFVASAEELEKLKQAITYNILVKDGDFWIPFL